MSFCLVHISCGVCSRCKFITLEWHKGRRLMSNNQSCYFMMSSCTAPFSSLYLLSPAGNCSYANTSVCTFPSRHRVVNLFLQGYNKTWISTEDHSFEEKLVEDLAVRAKVSFIYVRSWNYFSSNNFCLRGKFTAKVPWILSKKKDPASSGRNKYGGVYWFLSTKFLLLMWFPKWTSFALRSFLFLKPSWFCLSVHINMLKLEMFLWTVSKLKWASFSSWTADESADGAVRRWERRRKWPGRRHQSHRSSPPAHYALRPNCPDGKQVCVCVCAFVLVLSLWKGQ